MLNYDNGKSPLAAISAGYEERGKSKPNDGLASDSIEQLRKLQEQGHDLSPIQRMTLGFADLTKKNEQQAQERRDLAQQRQDQHNEQQEQISTESKEFKTLADDMAKMQAELAKMSKGEGEE